MDIKKMMDLENVHGLSTIYFEDGDIKQVNCFGVVEKNTSQHVTAHTIFHACSMSKMITAICILKLHQDGVINICDDVNQYLKSWKFPSNNLNIAPTIADLLAHQGGVVDPYDFTPVEGMILPQNINILQEFSLSKEDSIFTNYKPKEKFEYSDTGYLILEVLIEDVSKKRFIDFVAQTIFTPLRLKDAFFWSNNDKNIDLCVVGHDKTGEVVKGKRAIYPNIGGAGLWCTPTDFAIIAIDLLKSFNNNSGFVLNQKTAKLMLNSYGCVDFSGLGVFLGNYNNRPYFYSQGWGVGMQCKAIAFINEQTGAIAMMNSEPGKEQSQSIIGLSLRDLLSIDF